MGDDVALQRRLSLAEPIPRMIPVVHCGLALAEFTPILSVNFTSLVQ